MAAPLILAEVKPRRIDTGAEVTVLLAGGGGLVPYRYDDRHWLSGISGLPRIITSIDYNGTDLGTGSVPQAMTLSWAPSSSAVLAQHMAYLWDDAAITVRRGPEGTYPPVLTTGKVLTVTVDSGVAQIALADPATDLRKPILTDRYAGTGGLEGPAEWDGKLKRRLWGRLFNLTGDPIDAANRIYCYADPTRPLQAFDAVRDKGAAAAAEKLVLLAWQGTAATTFAALQSAVAPEGGGVLCPSIACIKWWTQPAGDLCVDLRGEVGAGYVETAASLAARIAGVVSTVPFAAGTVAVADAARPIAVGWKAEEEGGTAAAALDALLSDVSLMWALEDDAIQIRRWEWTAPVASARSLSVTRKATFKPVGRRRLGYRKNQNVMNRDSIAGIVFVGNGDFTGDLVDSSGAPLTEADVVTSQGTSNDTSNVAGVPAGDLVNDQIAGQIAQVAAASNAELARLRDRALLFAGDGADVKTLVRREIDARVALASLVTTAIASLGSVTSSVQQLLEAFSDGESGYARFLLRAEVDEVGQPTSIVGIEGLAGAAGSLLQFVADKVAFVDPTSGDALIYFDAVAGKMVAHAVEVDTLKVNTAVVPVWSTASTTLTGAGVGASWQTALSASIVLPSDGGWVEVQALSQQGFSSGDQDWAFRLLVDGSTTFTVSGGRTQDSVPLNGALVCAGGTHNVELQWRAHSSVSLGNRNLFVKGFPRTE
jgi:hypothetical protein